MSSFKIKIEGLELLKAQLKKDSSIESIIPDVSTALLLFHTRLEDRVNKLYSAPGNLTNVLIGRSVKPERQGKTFLRFSLQYRYSAIPLVLYPHNESIVSVNAKWPARKGNGFVTWKYKGYAKQVNVFIRRDRSVIAKRNNDYRRKAFLANGKIQARWHSGKHGTWKVFPSMNKKGERAPYGQLVGPSLSQLAKSVYDKDQAFSKEKDILADSIIDSFLKYYK